MKVASISKVPTHHINPETSLQKNFFADLDKLAP